MFKFHVGWKALYAYGLHSGSLFKICPKSNIVDSCFKFHGVTVIYERVVISFTILMSLVAYKKRKEFESLGLKFRKVLYHAIDSIKEKIDLLRGLTPYVVAEVVGNAQGFFSRRKNKSALGHLALESIKLAN